MPAATIRSACREDVPQLLALIRGLAEFEALTHLLEVDEARLASSLFGQRPQAEALLAWQDGAAQAAGFALFFHNYSTFLGKPGLYLEDLYVRPEQRGQGIGAALMVELARLALARDCGRFEWSVLDWNIHAQRFYERLGATVMPDWRVVRVTGDALQELAAHGRRGPGRKTDEPS